MDPALGTIVSIPQGRGVVRFSGPTSFSTGKWVGVELYEANGKNDGSVQGVSYFNCKPNYGVFVRQSQIKGTHGSELETITAKPRPALGHQRTPSTGLLKANSLKSPSSSSNASRAGSPLKVLANPLSPSATRLTRPLGTISPTKRTPSLNLQPRKSLSTRQSPAQDSSAPESPNSRDTDLPARLHATSSIAPAPAQTSSPLSLPLNTFSPPHIKSQINVLPATPTAKPQSRSPSPSNDINSKMQDDQELQELRAKIRVLEAKRADDSRHVRELETRLSEAESFVALRPKLQAKLNSQQTELIATRRELADIQQMSQLAESRVLDAQEQLEMAMLDKEVAEEKAELAQTELDELKEKLAIIEVEMNVMKGDDSEEESTPAKDSLAYIQLEKHNERLKEALIRLRDMTQETEQEHRKRIAEMEKDIVGIDELQSQYEESLIKLSNAETQIEDLKVQLDDALGAEEMLVQLTERNLMLGEKIEEMRITIEDLEALKELNDELEENHIETEKQLQDDLNAKDTQIHDQSRKIEALEVTCQDLDGTILQFRELVLQLQSDLDTLRTQTQTAQHESATAASQSAAMMSLNLKLQSSASKNQARNIELEVKKLEAREARELLDIVQPYLPQLYIDSDSDATSCYLLFRRLAYKADLINNIVAQVHNLPDALNGNVSEVLVGVCEMRGRLSGLSTLCKRFAAVLRRCDVETFLNIGRIYPEIAPLEKRIDMHIDLLRRDEFRDMECVSDVAKIQAQFDHLADTYFDGFDHDLSERELGYVMSFDHDLDMFTASVGLTKTSIAAIVQDEDAVLDMGDHDIDSELFTPLQTLLDQCKSTKTLSKKLTKRLEDLSHDAAALKPHLIPQMKALNNSVAEFVNFGISVAQQIMPHLSDVRSSKSSFKLATVLDVVKQTAFSTVAKGIKNNVSLWETISTCLTQLVEEGNQLLPSMLETENVFKVTGVAPWVTRVQEVKAALAVNVEAERTVAQLNDEMQGLARSLRAKDQSIQESAVKIELMERRLQAVKKQADTISELEGELSKARKQERAYEEAMEQLQADLDTLEQDNVKLKTLTAGQERQPTGAQPAELEAIPNEASFETSYLIEQIDALRGTVRYLRTENSYLRGQDLLREIESLPPLPVIADSTSRTTTPPLDPSGISDTDDSDSESPRPPVTLRNLATETKVLYRDVIKFSSSPRVVDLSALHAKRAEAKTGKVWLPKKKMPAHQVWERKMQAENLSRRVQGLLERASAL